MQVAIGDDDEPVFECLLREGLDEEFVKRAPRCNGIGFPVNLVAVLPDQTFLRELSGRVRKIVWAT